MKYFVKGFYSFTVLAAQQVAAIINFYNKTAIINN